MYHHVGQLEMCSANYDTHDPGRMVQNLPKGNVLQCQALMVLTSTYDQKASVLSCQPTSFSIMDHGLLHLPAVASNGCFPLAAVCLSS